MRLVVKQDDSTINEFQFTKGPIYIGRHANSQILLRHRAVSRQHALNDEPIHKTEINTGDVIRIVDFTIEISLEEGTEAEKPIELEDTLTKTAYELEASLATPPHDIIVRKPDAGHAPAMRLAAKRLMDFSEATREICKAGASDELLLTLLEITLKQFGAHRVWCALRSQPAGPMTSHAGKHRDGKSVDLSEIMLKEKIMQAVEKGQYLVLPRVSAQIEKAEGIRSAMIAPIILPAGCFGVLYVDNAMDQEHYSLGDLDYLMLLAIHTASVTEKL
jgi:GAF domain-containing protein